jgi:putative nucleotidyltransferase with HDIG domain
VRDFMNPLELRQRLDRTSSLPSFPAVVSKIIAAVDDPRASASQLQELVSQEPALAARMLRLANSAYFGRRNGIVSLRQCAVVLGFNTIRSLALSASIQRVIQQSSVKSFDLQSFWHHSLGTGVGARALARRAGADPEAAMAAGLIHDIGKLVFDVLAPTDYSTVLERTAAGTPEPDAERQVFGATHSEAGAWLAAKWKLPPQIVACIEAHDRPEAAGEHRALAAVVRLANELAKTLAAGGHAADLDRGIWPDAGIQPDDPAAVEEEFQLEWKQAEDMMGTGSAEAPQAA